MANNFNIKGTINPSFRIGKTGPTLYQASSVPSTGDGADGDVWIVQAGGSSGMYQKAAGNWGVVSNPSIGSLGTLTPGINNFIFGDNGTSWTTGTGSVARTAIGLGITDSPTFTSATIPLLNGAVTINGDLQVFGTTTTIHSNNLLVDDVNITVNKSGLTANAVQSGINIEGDGNTIVGYLRSALDNTKLEFKAPMGQKLILDVSSTSTLLINSNLTISGASSINQDVSTSGAPLFDSVVLDGASGGNLGSGSINAKYLYIDGVAVIGGVSNLNDLTDVTLSSIITNDILVFNGTQWVNTNGTTARTAIGLGTANTPQFTGSKITSDNTIKSISSEYIVRNSTTDNTPTELFLDGISSQMVLSDDTTWAFNITIVARRTNLSLENARYNISGCIARDTGVLNTYLVGDNVTAVSEDDIAWDVTVSADTSTGALKILVTGENTKDIKWVGFIRTAEVTN